MQDFKIVHFIFFLQNKNLNTQNSIDKLRKRWKKGYHNLRTSLIVPIGQSPRTRGIRVQAKFWWSWNLWYNKLTLRIFLISLVIIYLIYFIQFCIPCTPAILFFLVIPLPPLESLRPFLAYVRPCHASLHSCVLASLAHLRHCVFNTNISTSPFHS
jgi:hypothetical protein